jgi:uncharacterized membrane protein
MTPGRTTSHAGKVKHPQFVLFLILLLLTVGALNLIMDAGRAILFGFDFAAVVFIVATFASMRGASPEHLRAAAVRNDAGRLLLLLIAAIALLVILIVVGVELGRPGEGDAPRIALVVLTLAIAWLFGNLVYALHYAHIFYDPGPEGGDHEGLAFPRTRQPDFLDFCYFALVIGMTFQVSDVAIVSRRIRRAATIHGLVAFFFNIGVVTLTVNVVASAI